MTVHLYLRNGSGIICGADADDLAFGGPFDATCPECVARLPPQWQQWRSEYMEHPTPIARAMAERLWVAHPTDATQALCRAQAAAPELRLGQLVVDVLGDVDPWSGATFYRPDADALVRLRAFVDRREETEG